MNLNFSFPTHILGRLRASLKARARGWRRKAYRRWLWLEYRLTRPVSIWLCGQGWFQRRHADITATVSQFMCTNGVPSADQAHLLRHTLANNLWREKWFAAHYHNGLWLGQVSGREHLEAALRLGQGVVLVHYHGSFTSLCDVWLTQNGFAPFHTVGLWARDRQEDWRKPLVRIMESARDLKTAHETLQQGRIVRIFPDGYKGSRFNITPFCGRLQRFPTSFAELALQNSAPILPTSLTPDARGRLHLRFGPPFAVLQADYVAQVKSLVEQYAAYLSHQWQTQLTSIPWKRIKRHLANPPA